MPSKKVFLGKVVLISGASGDIGQATAKAFADDGAILILHSFKNRGKVEDFIAKNKRNKIVHINCDGTSEELVALEINRAMKLLKADSISALVNVAGDLIERRSVENLDWNFVRKTLEVNVKSAFAFTKAALSKMGRGSSIVFVSSLTARWGKGDRSSAYSLAKGAILSWSKSLANELGPRGIRVNSVTPGFIRGHFHDKYTNRDVEKSHADRNPLGRVGLPGDVAAAIIFLSSSGAGYVNGVTLDVCGGDYIN